MPLKISRLTLMLIFGFLLNPLLANANTQPDPLQYYRDQIKRSETNASQTIEDQVQSNTPSNPVSVQPSPTPTTPPPGSNTDKAFSAPPSTQSKPSINANDSTSAENPWLKPNPWKANAEVNPWANARIPGPNGTATPTPPAGPPNIFAPPHPTTNTPNDTGSAKKTFS